MATGIYIRTNEHKQKIGDALRGKKLKPFTQEHKKNLSKSLKGRTVWNKGLKGYMEGARNSMWKGDSVSYRNLHRWVERKLGKAMRCMKNMEHKSTRYHWANISKEYRRDLTDWMQMCPSCNLRDRKEGA